VSLALHAQITFQSHIALQHNPSVQVSITEEPTTSLANRGGSQGPSVSRLRSGARFRRSFSPSLLHVFPKGGDMTRRTALRPGAGPIKTESDHGSIFRRIWKAGEFGPVAVLQEFLSLDGEHCASFPIGLVEVGHLAGECDVAAELPLRLDARATSCIMMFNSGDPNGQVRSRDETQMAFHPPAVGIGKDPDADDERLTSDFLLLPVRRLLHGLENHWVLRL